MWSNMTSFVKRHPLPTFIALAYLFSWWPALLYLFRPMPVAVASFGPFLAALVVLSLTSGKTGVKDLLRQMIRWRVGWPWYLVALGLPALLAGIAVVLNVLLGAPAPSSAQLAAWPSILPTFLLVLLVPGLGGAWEEPGWRGYATNQLERGHSKLWALAPLWLIIVVWHLPLFLTGDIERADVFNMIGGVIIYNWLYHQSGRSVLLVMIIHAANNAVSGEYFSPMFTGAYSAQMAWLRTLMWGIAALIVLVAYWRWWTESTSETVVDTGNLAEAPASQTSPPVPH